MKIAIAGVGHIHLADFIEELKKARLESGFVYDPDPAKAKAVAGNLGWEAIDDLGALFAANVAGFIVASETGQHQSIVPVLADSGRPLFVEKPLAPTPTEAAELIAHFRAGQIFHTGYFLREYPAVMAIKEKIDQGKFGEIQSIHISYSHDGLKNGWFAPGSGYEWLTDQKRAGLGGFGDLGLHCIDLATWLSGQKPANLQAEIGRLPNFLTDVPDHFGTAIMTGNKSTKLSFYAGWTIDPHFRGQTAIEGSNFSVEVTGSNGHAFFTRNLAWFRDDKGNQENLDPKHLGSGAGVAIFLRALRENRPELTTGLEKPLQDIKLLDAALQSCRRRSAVGVHTKPRW